MTKHTILLILLNLIFISSCNGSKATYSIAASMHSELGYGIILHEFPTTHAKGSNSKVKIHPTIPRELDGITRLKKFKGYEGKKIPSEITIKYQYAKVSNCAHSDKRTPFDHKTRKPAVNSPEYYDLIHCKKWQPFGDIYTKTIDLKPYQKSEAMRKIGKRNSSGKRYMAKIYFEFYDNQDIKIRVKNWTSQVW